jgi:Pyruvate/2-oxoacid:ferredoxin oxidoreductase gamma subunit
MIKKEIAVNVIAMKILMVRGKRVMLDRDLAQLYGVKAIALRQQVKRNKERFPEDFMFRLNSEEAEMLVSQNVIPSVKYFGGFLPYVFTQEGIAMLSSVLTSSKAVRVNIAIMRAFVKLGQIISSHKELAEKLEELERKYQLHETDIQVIFEAIKKLIEPPDEPPKPRFGLN